jgi:hypothetical protein
MGRIERTLDAEMRQRAAELAREFALRYRPAENRP